MSLRLSPEDLAEYERRCAVNQKAKEDATAIGDARSAKKARQANTRLYGEFESRQLPPERKPRVPSLEERIEALENDMAIVLTFIRGLAGVKHESD